MTLHWQEPHSGWREEAGTVRAEGREGVGQGEGEKGGRVWGRGEGGEHVPVESDQKSCKLFEG